MALAEKYRVHINSMYSGVDRVIRIYAEGFSGSVSNLLASATPAVLEFPGADADVQTDCIMGSELTVNLISLTEDQFIEFATASHMDYMAIIYGGANDWFGWLVPQEYEAPFNQPPYTTTIRFSDGLGLLSSMDYLDSNGDYHTGLATELSVLANLLSKLYPSTIGGGIRPVLSVSVSLREANHDPDVTKSCFIQTYVNQDKYISEDGTVWNCLDVLKDLLLSYGAMIRMGYLGFWILRIRDFAMVQTYTFSLSFQRYSLSGVYVAASTLTPTTCVRAITTPGTRASTVFWRDAGQRVRYERAYQSAIVEFDYHYRNVLMRGNFQADDWEDFWTVTWGTALRIKSYEVNEYYIRLYGDSSNSNAVYTILDQTILDMEAGASQKLIFAISCMVQMVSESDTTDFTVMVFLDSDSGTDDRYLVGRVGSVAPASLAWQAGVGFIEMTTESNIIYSNSWYDFTLVFPAIPFDGNLLIRLQSSAAGGDVSTTNFKNILLWGTYNEIAPGEKQLETFVINENNLRMIDPLQINSGDIILSGNEGVYNKGAKFYGTDKRNLTTTWRTYRISGGNHVAVGPSQTLVDYLIDNLITQHGICRKRLMGSLNCDNKYLVYSIFSYGGIYYMPTQILWDIRAMRLDISMVELPNIYQNILTDNLITGWTNDSWDVFVSNTPPLIDVVGDSAPGTGIAHSNTIAHKAYEVFRCAVSGTFNGPGDVYVKIDDTAGYVDIYDGAVFILTAGATVGNHSIILENVDGDSTSVNNLLIQVWRVYGF